MVSNLSLPLDQRWWRGKVNFGFAVSVSRLMHAVGRRGFIGKSRNFIGSEGNSDSAVGHFNFRVTLLLLRRAVMNHFLGRRNGRRCLYGNVRSTDGIDTGTRGHGGV